MHVKGLGMIFTLITKARRRLKLSDGARLVTTIFFARISNSYPYGYDVNSMPSPRYEHDIYSENSSHKLLESQHELDTMCSEPLM